MAEVILTRIRNLERENRELRQELALTIAERDEAVNKAVEMMHINTYTMEVMQRKGLEVVK